MEIRKVECFTVPMYGNNNGGIYGKLKISVSGEEHIVRFKQECCEPYRHYFTWNRKRIYIHNIGSLYSPKFELAN